MKELDSERLQLLDCLRGFTEHRCAVLYSGYFNPQSLLPFKAPIGIWLSKTMPDYIRRLSTFIISAFFKVVTTSRIGWNIDRDTLNKSTRSR